MKSPNASQEELLKLAKQAADQFASGNIIGALGIVGIVMLVGGGVVLLLDKVPDSFSILAGTAGSIFILLSGFLYLQKIRMRHDALMVMARGYFDITTQLTSKVNPGTVAATDIQELARTYFRNAMGLLSESDTTPK
jgi:hypothetical protein